MVEEYVHSSVIKHDWMWSPHWNVLCIRMLFKRYFQAAAYIYRLQE
jgi:hypothetical protein